MNIAITYDNIIDKYAREDENELIEIESIETSLRKLGFTPIRFPVSMNVNRSTFMDFGSSFVFNCVDSLEESGRLAHIVPTLLDELGIPYTGSPSEAIYLTSNKIITKQFLKASDILTPPWMTLEEVMREHITFDPPYIIKSLWEDASFGLDENSIVYSRKTLKEEVIKKLKNYGNNYLVSSYIDGREFNVSLLADGDGPQILPPLEIEFRNFPKNRPRFIDYETKWIKDSFGYQNTFRNFDFSEEDLCLLYKLADISEKCWFLFNLKGYARIDFRVDHDGVPWVLEINTNPYLGTDSSFLAATEKAELTFNEVIKRIIRGPLRKIKSYLPSEPEVLLNI